jgi:steroid delta-isomerase-like uncharacterized protein
MSPETNKTIARREIEGFESQGNPAVADEVLSDDYRLHYPGFPTLDREGHKQVIAAFHVAFPDLQIQVEAQVAEGDRVASHFVMQGTHQGPFQGIAPTGKTVAVTGTNLMRLQDGKIVELWGHLDSIGLLQQLGVLPAPEAS